MSETASDTRITAEITRIPLHYPHMRNWWLLFGFSLVLLGCFFVAAGALFLNGVGMWGNNIPVNWGLAISNYVWFLGIGHAGTLIPTGHSIRTLA
jgi:molybdopterin-containing oxidoreductase family membrane subunit